MKIKTHYDQEDDVLTIYSDIAPRETIEVEDFINIDITKNKEIVGIELFEASHFFGKQNKEITKEFLSKTKEIRLKYDEWRNNWFINIELIDSKNHKVIQQLPPLKKSEYTSPLIASVN
jgi:uncharacterized protein YuzE